MKVTLTAQQRGIVANNNGLSRYLDSLQEGRPFTPRSWLYEKQDPDTVLAEWEKTLEILQTGDTFEQNVYQFDISQKEKWGPQGGIAPIAELMPQILDSFKAGTPKPAAFETEAWKLAKQDIVKTIASGPYYRRLRPAAYSAVVDDMRARDTLESNSGWPLFTRRSKPEVKEASMRDAASGAWREYPAIALFRNYNKKTRLVWMFPMATNLVEGSFVQPLQSMLMNRGFSFLAPWKGFEEVRQLVTKAYDQGEYLAASDFTSTDEHFTRYSTLEVYDVIKECFQQQYHAALLESMLHMNSIPLVVGPNEIVVGDHGISSGSNWTNFVETIFDWILSAYVWYQQRSLVPNQYERYSGLYAIGDDMSWRSKAYRPDFAEKLEVWGSDVGQIIKTEKTTNFPDRVKSLQRLFQRGYKVPQSNLVRGVYSTIRALKSSVYPERFHNPKLWSSDMFCARQFMILENCVDHPLFEQFVKFVVKGQKDLIPFAKLTRGKLDQIARETKLLPGLNPTYNQEKRDASFADFASIRIAASL